MANPEHVEVAKKGKEAIAAWRKRQFGSRLDLAFAENAWFDFAMSEREPGSRLDLTNADLSGTDLREARLRQDDLTGAILYEANLTHAFLGGANLTRANLTRANLFAAFLSRANLTEADLREAGLHRTDLSRATLHRALMRQTYLYRADLHEADLTETLLIDSDLIEADLRKADLCGADLTGVDFARAELSGSNMAKTRIGGTSFANVDMSGVLGLDTVEHLGPSTIGVDTILRSKGRIPDVFLRGCGVSEGLIQQLSDFFNSAQPAHFHSYFISHGSKDDNFARQLQARLRTENLRVWLAPESKSCEQINETDERLLLVLSNNSVARRWVQPEIRRLMRKERSSSRRVLFPVCLVPPERIRGWRCVDSTYSSWDLAESVREHCIHDFSKWEDPDAFEASFVKLMEDLRAEDAAKPA